MNIKKGATMRLALLLDESEWSALHPWDSIEADALQRHSLRTDLTVTVDEAARAILLTGPTDDMVTSIVQIDVKIMRSGEVIYLPPERNLLLSVIDGVTE